MTAPRYFVADIHAGIRQDSDEAAKLRAFEELCGRVVAEGASLWVLGDLFDFWYEWKQVIPKRHFRWLRVLESLGRAGCPLHLFPGNHDFRLEGFLEETIGATLHREPDRDRLGDLGLVMHHGDGLDPSDRGYRLLRKGIRNPVSYTLFRWLHPDAGMALADRSGSRDRSHAWDEAFTRRYLSLAMEQLMAPGDDLLLMGHAHRFVRHEVEGRLAIVLPPFQHASRGWLRWDGEELLLHYAAPEHASHADGTPLLRPKEKA